MSSSSLAARFARLRGSLRPQPIGARDLEHLGRNPACTRQAALCLSGITPAVALSHIYGEGGTGGQSPFAIAHGTEFERQLRADDAAAIRECYHQAGRSDTDDWIVVDIPARVGGKGPNAFVRREALTRYYLSEKVAGRPDAPHLVLHPRLVVTIAGVRFALEPDALVAIPGARCYRIMEFKSYADRGGMTDPADLRSACRQAAVGLIALRQALIGLVSTMTHIEAATPTVADLVLRHVGSMRPILRSMTIGGEFDSLSRTFARAEQVVDHVDSLLGPAVTLDDPAVLDMVPHHYTGSCREFCALAPRCKREAIAQGDLALLGDAARDRLAAAGTIPRVLDLMHVRGAPPRDAAEAALQQWLREGYQACWEAVGDVA